MREDNFWTSRARRSLNRRLLLTATTAVGAGLALIGCSTKKRSGQQAGTQSGNQAAGSPRTGGTLNVYLPTNYPLDAQKNSGAGQVLPGAAMSRIFRFKSSTDPNRITDHDPENDLGLSAESPDAVTWTVKLRPDAKFHDTPPVNGHAVEAEDIKATFARALDPATVNPNRGALNMIDAAQIQTPDKQTVVFRLNYPYAPFVKILSSPTYSWIFPREAFAGGYDPNKRPIGSGPLHARYRHA